MHAYGQDVEPLRMLNVGTLSMSRSAYEQMLGTVGTGTATHLDSSAYFEGTVVLPETNEYSLPGMVGVVTSDLSQFPNAQPHEGWPVVVEASLVGGAVARPSFWTRFSRMGRLAQEVEVTIWRENTTPQEPQLTNAKSRHLPPEQR